MRAIRDLLAVLCLLGGAGRCRAETASVPARLLTGGRDAAGVQDLLVPSRDWAWFPPARDRAAWEALLAAPLNAERLRFAVERAEALLGEPWPALPATLYMEFARTGDRSRYEGSYFQRRLNLATLVLAECFEHEGRFLDEIANGIWAIAEESSWCIPAHAARAEGDVLHRLDTQSLDLFACETGMTFATAWHLLGAELAGLSPALEERLRTEVKRRILDPFAADEFSSRGWLNGYNNWTPWCASNVLGAFFILEPDGARLADVTLRLMTAVDRFIDRYGADGGCDEGPGYWGEAGGAMLVFLELLSSRTAGAVDIYGSPKIRAMGEYIAHVRLAGPWFANFADADARCHPHAGKVYRYGERVGSVEMRELALLAARDWKPDGPVTPPLQLSGVSRPLLGPLMELFWVPPVAAPRGLPRPEHVWLPDVQVLVARESPRDGQGLVLAAKGGHNAESHNHNDVGHFMLFWDGLPGVVDLGRETYRRETFSSRRYELWFTRGRGHNAPVINGFEQAPGAARRAADVACDAHAGGASLRMDLAGAYPAEAGVRRAGRSLRLLRGDGAQVQIRDSIEAEGPRLEIELNLYSPQPVRVREDGALVFGDGERRLVLEFDRPQLAATVERLAVADAALRENWGPALWQIRLRGESATGTLEYGLRFAIEPRGGSMKVDDAAAVARETQRSSRRAA